MYLIGIDPGSVYTQDQMKKGKCPVAGTMAQTADGKIYRMVEVTTSQNLTKGMIATIDQNHKATVAIANGPAPTSQNQIGVIVATVTASASSFVWAQLYGPTSVLASLSCLPNLILTGGTTAGNVDDSVSTLSAVIEGLWLTATSSVTGLSAAMLNYPRYRTHLSN